MQMHIVFIAYKHVCSCSLCRHRYWAIDPLAPRFSRLARAAEVWATNIQFPLPCVPWPSHRDISILDTTTAPPLKRRFWWWFFSDEYIDGSSQRVYLFALRFHRLVINMPCQNWWPSRWLHLLFQFVPGDCVHCFKNQFFSQQERLKAGFPCCRVCNTNATLWARHCIGRNSMSMCVEIPRQMSGRAETRFMVTVTLSDEQ